MSIPIPEDFHHGLLTYSTDFAQVEMDQQQINLNRFNPYFPEKRPFFLVNAGVFSVSSVRQVAAGTPGQTELFFSRGIGIVPGGREIPILGGVRLSVKLSDSVSVGLLNMQTEAVDGLAPATIRGDLWNAQAETIKLYSSRQ